MAGILALASILLCVHSGCTAVSAADMGKILRRLRPEANPLLIQLPQGEYERLRGPRGLP